MPCYPVVPGVRFNDSLFSEPEPLAGWRPPACAGIVAILTRNPQWSPKPLQPLYFGEFGNDAGRAASLHVNARREELLVSTMQMPYSTAAQRRALCRELIAAYNPACQSNGSVISASELACKVEQLEARQQEQSDQILSLLTHLGKMFEPCPVVAPRPIGFMPATESGS